MLILFTIQMEEGPVGSLEEQTRAPFINNLYHLQRNSTKKNSVKRNEEIEKFNYQLASLKYSCSLKIYRNLYFCKFP